MHGPFFPLPSPLQASFDPPGLTVAVKRDRAVESMLPVGSGFVLNVLAEGKDKAVMKQMLKPFKPAEDRFAGMEVLESEVTGAAVIPEAAAFLECSVASHWPLTHTTNGSRSRQRQQQPRARTL